MIKHHPITKTQMDETTISRWVRPEGHDISVVTLSEPVYGTSINVLHGKYSEAGKYIKYRTEYEIGAKATKGSFVYAHDKITDGGPIYFMIIPQNDWCADDYSTIVHELHHFTHYALGNMGIEHCKESEECFAYFQGYFMDKIVRAFVELKKTNKKKKK